jgi:cytochrome c peroxidase
MIGFHVPSALRAAAIAFLTGVLTGSGAFASDAPSRAGVAKWIGAYKRPTSIPDSASNPSTPAKVALGKALFFDPRMSGSGAISCATCHNPALGWQDALATGLGHHGTQLARHTPTIIDVAWVEPLFWDGRAETLEDQAKGPLANPNEMDMPHADVVKAVKDVTGYQTAFAAAFPGEEITIDTVAKAIASYERTVVSGEAPFDHWVDGDDRAITASAKRGFVVFNDKGNCSACHSGWRFTDDGFHDIGLASADIGRAKILPGVPVLEHAFKTPTLRNIASRAPYMHDGSLKTLDEVIDHYDRGFVQRPSLAPEMKQLNLSARDKKDLIAFLDTLSSDDGDVTVPELPR